MQPSSGLILTFLSVLNAISYLRHCLVICFVLFNLIQLIPIPLSNDCFFFRIPHSPFLPGGSRAPAFLSICLCKLSAIVTLLPVSLHSKRRRCFWKEGEGKSILDSLTHPNLQYSIARPALHSLHNASQNEVMNPGWSLLEWKSTGIPDNASSIDFLRKRNR